MNKYYVYGIMNTDKKLVYIGKGSRARVYRQAFNINKDADSFYSNGGDITELITFFYERVSERDAFALERQLIDEHLDSGFDLINLRLNHSKDMEWRQKISESNKGKHNHWGANNPNRQRCLYTETNEVFETLKELCDSKGFNYSSVKSSLSRFKKTNKQNKYSNLISYV
jgi:hypothetical protein